MDDQPQPAQGRSRRARPVGEARALIHFIILAVAACSTT
jgi:hypothetical protein